MKTKPPKYAYVLAIITRSAALSTPSFVPATVPHALTIGLVYFLLGGILGLISPEAHATHPNRFRYAVIQIGGYICSESYKIAGLVSHLFYQLQFIPYLIMRAIYFHHELVRLYPYSDGNGRVARIAKNWMLMYELYPPIFVKD